MKKIIPILMFLMFATIGLADNTAAACLNVNTSQENITIYNATSGSVMIALLENVTCPFGCDNATGFCTDSNINLGSIGIIIVVSFLAFIFMFASSRKELKIPIAMGNFEIDPLQLLFLGLSLWMILMDFSIAMDFAKVSGHGGVYGILTGGWSGLTWSFVLIGFILVVMFLYFVFKTVVDFAKRRGK